MSGQPVLQQVADDVVPERLFVHRVGLDVLGVEVPACRRSAEPFPSLAHATGGGHGGDLGDGEMPDERAARAPVQGEQRHHVHRREFAGRDMIEAGAVAVGQARRGQQLREQPGMRLLGPATSE